MDSTTTVQRLWAAVSALFVSSVPAVVFAHGGTVNLSHGCVSKNKGGGARSRHLCLALLVPLGFLLGGRHVAQAAASFTFTPIDVPGASFTLARGINPSGQIVGDYFDGTGSHGFLYDGGVFTTIDVPGAISTEPFGINPSGQIVGQYGDSTGGAHGFLYDEGVFTTIDVPGASLTGAFGINPSGQIVGIYGDSTGGHGFLYDGGVFTPVDVPGAFSTSALGINPSGQIVGSYGDDTAVHGFLATPKKK